MAFIELRAHTAFSFGDGVLSPESLVEKAAAMGYRALGLTDHVDLGGIIRFTLAAERAGVKPVVGAELEVDGYPVALLARNAVGYRNLAALVTRSRMGRIDGWENGRGNVSGAGVWGGFLGNRNGTETRNGPETRNASRTGSAAESRVPPGHPHSAGGSGIHRGYHEDVHPSFPRNPPQKRARETSSLTRKYSVPLPDRGRPALTFDDVAERSEGLWCLTGPSSGEFATHVRTDRRAEAVYLLDRWRAVFGSRLAIEVQLHHTGGHEAALAASLIELAERGRVRWAISNDPRYANSAGRLVHDLLTANRAGVCVNTAASWGLLLPNGEWRLKSPSEMALLWRGRESGLEATNDIADDCSAFDLHWLRPPLPKFPVPPGHTDDTWLRELAFSGARDRWGEVDERQRTQIEHELRVIGRLGFAGFFLVMWDAVRHARSLDILCQGRGSAANSAVAYCLGITAVDPVRHGLLFERFLSEARTDGRTEAPDIDVDFEMHRREEVLNYMYDNYRRQHAAITAVTQVFHAPTALQDVMRALGYPAEFSFRFSKRLHHLEPSEGAEMLRDGLAAEYGLSLDDPRGRSVLSAMSVLDDVPRMRSTHPGGFVLSSEPLGDYMPIEHTTMGRTILQFDKDDLDAAGVPKFDFLGLGGLSAVHLAFDAIRERTGEKLELYRLPVDDERTYEMIARGDTVGTFQIESRAQIQSILATKPDRLYDIVVQVALIRPGPIQAKFVHPYTERRRGRQEIRYAHPLLEPILRRTYGVPIFQEQAMAISMALGGFTASEADELRRAMGHHRKIERLKRALDHLRERCVERGIAPETADEVVTDLLSFANYGFPESHAWSFALIAYATAWLKANYPAEFLLGLLNAWPMGFYPPATLVHDARRAGVRVLGPCLKDGAWECELVASVSGAGFWGGFLGNGNKQETRNDTRNENEDAGHTVRAEDAGTTFHTEDTGYAEGTETTERARTETRNEFRNDRVGTSRSDDRNDGSVLRNDRGIAGRSVVGSESGGGVVDRTVAGGEMAANAADRPCYGAPPRPSSIARSHYSAATPSFPRNPPQKPAPETSLVPGRSPVDAAAPVAPPPVRIGWKHIQGLGEAAKQALQVAHMEGPFRSIADVVKRAKLTRSDALQLARAGAFEAFRPGRRKAAWEALRAAGDLLPLAPARVLPFEPREMEGDELVFLDYLATGISTHGHPLEFIRPRLESAGVTPSNDLDGIGAGDRILVAGLVVARQHPATAKGTVFVLLEDEWGFINVIVPRNTYARYREVVKFSQFLVVEGRFEREDRVLNVIGWRFRELKVQRSSVGDVAYRSRDFH